VHAGRQGCAEVVRDLKPLACCRDQIQPCTQRSSFVLLAAPNNSSFEAHMFNTGLCQLVKARSCSRLPQRHCSSFVTAPPALAAATQTRISPCTSRPHPRSTADLATLFAMAILQSRNMCSAPLNASSLMSRPDRLRHAQSVALCV